MKNRLKALVTLTLALVFILIVILTKLNLVFIFLFEVMFPFFIAFLIAWSVNPLINYFERKKINRTIGVLLTVLLFFITIIGFVAVIIPVFIKQFYQLIDYIPNINETIIQVQENINNYFNIRTDLTSIVEKLFVFLQEQPKDVIEKFLLGSLSILDSTFTILSGIISFLATTFIVIVASIYMMLDFNKFIDKLYKVAPKRFHDDFTYYINGFYNIMVEFFRSSILITIILFVIVTVALTLLGLEGAVVLAFIIAVTNLIPYIGPYIGSIPAGIVALTLGWEYLVAFIIIIIIVQQIESSFIRPKLMGKSLNLHPALGLISVILFGAIFGIVGMIFAMPLMSMISLILKNIYRKLIDKYPEVMK